MTIHPKTRASYESKAELYFNDEGDGVPLVEHSAVSKLIPDLTGKSILSVGCGAGRELLALSSRKPRAISAIEPARFLIEKARERNPTATIIQAGIEEIPFPDGSFDFLYCGHVLHYFRSWTTALAELRRVLSDRGKLLVTLHHPLDWALVHEGSRRILGYAADRAPIGNYLELQELSADWYGGFETVYYVRSIEKSINEFLERGFNLERVAEAGFKADSRLPIYFALLLSRSESDASGRESA